MALGEKVGHRSIKSASFPKRLRGHFPGLGGEDETCRRDGPHGEMKCLSRCFHLTQPATKIVLSVLNSGTFDKFLSRELSRQLKHSVSPQAPVYDP